VSRRVTLVPRAAASARAARAWLEASPLATSVAADHFLIDISSADITTQAEVFLDVEQGKLAAVIVEMATADIAFGAPLVLELRRFCEEIAGELDLVVETKEGRREVGELFDSGTI
jgi:hypothetical protein